MNLRMYGMVALVALASIWFMQGGHAAAMPTAAQLEAGSDVDAHVAEYLDAQELVRSFESTVGAHLPLSTDVLNDDDVALAWGYFNDQGSVLEVASVLLGVDTTATISVDGDVVPLNDYSPFDYSVFLQEEALALLELTDGQYSDAEVYLDDVRATGDALALAVATDNVVISKIASIFGIRGVLAGFQDAMVDVMGDELEELGKQIDQKQVRKALGTVKQSFSKATGEKFRKKLVEKVGKKAAGKALAKIGSRFVPFVGWAVVAGASCGRCMSSSRKIERCVSAMDLVDLLLARPQVRVRLPASVRASSRAPVLAAFETRGGE
jgi:hypothetical protein